MNVATGIKGAYISAFIAGKIPQVREGKHKGEEGRLNLGWGNQTFSARRLRPLGSRHLLKVNGYLSRYQRQSTQSSQRTAVLPTGLDTMLQQTATVISRLNEAHLNMEIESYLGSRLTWEHGLEYCLSRLGLRRC